MQNRKLNRIKTALAVILLALTFFSVTILTFEVNHKCSGQDCIVCLVIQISQNSIKLLNLAAAFTFTIKNFFCILRNEKNKSQSFILNSESLVAKKIKLND